MMVDLAAPAFIEHRDPGDEHSYPHPYAMLSCPSCGAPQTPEPTDAERDRLISDANYEWFPPDGEYLVIGYGLMGGGHGVYAVCDRCNFFHKVQEQE